MQSLDPDSHAQTIINRKFVLCENLGRLGFADLIRQCDGCGHFFATCCSHSDRVCHHWPLVFTDGACLGNGKEEAQAGIGIAMGSVAEDRMSVPSSDLNWDTAAAERTSQRAELLAALEGINRASSLTASCYKAKLSSLQHRGPRDPADTDTRCWIITTDSEYVVKGITEWLSKWKRNGFRNASGNKVSNLDLFTLLDETISQLEVTTNERIGFWRVPRELNTIADDLAKRAARMDRMP
ncbi:hypothetical protein PQX77_010024 [Marasmius sp. AFHP31]|nr:hypothetical protein PQX77_010024 [Marasmius sp. AFHP31]